MGVGSGEENAATARFRVGIVGTPVGVGYGGIGGRKEETSLEAVGDT